MVEVHAPEVLVFPRPRLGSSEQTDLLRKFS